jgi:hypothetical protein
MDIRTEKQYFDMFRKEQSLTGSKNINKNVQNTNDTLSLDKVRFKNGVFFFFKYAVFPVRDM